MGKRISTEEFKAQASLSQKVSFNDDAFRELAGTDPETSVAIQAIRDCISLGLLPKPENSFGVKVLLTFLNGRRKALLSTSEKINEITKLGFMLPAQEASYYDD